MDERKIDFALVSSKRQVRGEGKTEREKAKRNAKAPTKHRRQTGRKTNFEPDSAFRNSSSQPAAAKTEKKSKKVSEKTRKIAAATKAKRAAKKAKPA
jgi:RNAse R (EC 3.1.-.-)